MAMKRFRILFLVSALAANLCAVSEAPRAQEAVKPTSSTSADTAKEYVPPPAVEHGPAMIRELRWLIGGVWTADSSKIAPGMKQIETRYRVSDNHAFIRFTTRFVNQTGVDNMYDGNFYYDEKTNSLAVWYMNPNSKITQGPVEIDGDAMTITFHGPDFEGNMADLRVKVLRKTNDDYQWSVAEKQGDSWKQLAQLEYLRQPRE
jgi:hypothetical protein